MEGKSVYLCRMFISSYFPKPMNIFTFGIKALISGAIVVATACSDEKPSIPSAPDFADPAPETTFAKGADVSWLTKLESEGYKFFTTSGKQKELMSLLRDDCGVNAIRLRVWVNPVDGWNGINDVMVKARRAKALGLRLMIDFHLSDTWADPGHQSTPAAWSSLTLQGLEKAVDAHISEMLTRLKAEDISAEWVQVGNETTQGMLWPVGRDSNPYNFAGLVNAGYDAVKKVMPEAKVIVHIDKGNDLWRYDHILGILNTNGGKYDMVGMSLYPEESTWIKDVDDMVANIHTIHTRYNKSVMLCEVGMRYNLPTATEAMISRIRTATEHLGYMEGIFYWEPEAPAGYNGGYDKGCFVNGTPTSALNSFKN